MKEIHVPRAEVRFPFETLADLTRPTDNDDLDRVLVQRRPIDDPSASWESFSLREYDNLIARTAKGLLAAGVRTGDYVAIMSRTRFEWTQIDLALWRIGAIPVPVYDTSSAEQARYILDDSQARAIFVETAEHARIIDQVRHELDQLTDVWTIDSGELDQLVERGDEVTDDALERAGATLTPDSIATVIYTSGTTGLPKGCELTHRNFVGLSESIVHGFGEIVYAPGASTVMFLPLAHVLQRVIQVAVLGTRMRIGHAPDIKHLLDDLQSFQPTFLLGVPRVFEKVFNASQAKASAGGRRGVFTQATRVAIAYSRALDSGRARPWVRLQHKLFDVLVYSKLRAAMGGKVTHAVCGGAQLGARLGHFYRGMGLTILEGYGLTETTAPVTAGTPKLNKVGTVGRPLSNTSVRISDDGEVLVKGVGVFKGYRNDPEATAEAFTEDGWLRTGDLGSVDSDGCLSLTGRTKEILVTAGGKNVYPGPTEDRIRAHPLVSQVMVVGDDRPFVGALVTIDADMAPAWGKGHNMPDLTAEAALTDPFVRERIQMAIDRANTNVSRAESVRKFRIIAGDFTEDNGMLTPSLKIRREVIADKLRDEIEALYEGGTLNESAENGHHREHRPGH